MVFEKKITKYFEKNSSPLQETFRNLRMELLCIFGLFLSLLPNEAVYPLLAFTFLFFLFFFSGLCIRPPIRRNGRKSPKNGEKENKIKISVKLTMPGASINIFLKWL